jgi:vitamin B12 transporter
MMYGADAGGIVSIRTRRGEPGFGGGASGEFGRFGTRQYGAYLGGGNVKADFSLSGSKLDTDGFNSRTTDRSLRDDDGYDNSTVHGSAGWNIDESLRAELIGHYVDGNNEYDDCFTTDFLPTDNCEDTFRQYAWRASLSHRGERFDNDIAYNKNDIKRTFHSNGGRAFDPLKGELAVAEYKGSWRGSDALRLVYGMEFRNEAIDDGAFDTDRDQRGYYLEYQGNFRDKLYVTAGTRYDDNDDFGSESTYRISAAYLLPMAAGELKLKGAYGTGFRAPSLYEIAYNDGPFSSPPASGVPLDAETSKGYDLGLAYYADGGWFLELVYFDQQVEDEIFFDLVAFSGYLQGDGDSTSKGVELSGELPMPFHLSLSGNYTYNDTEDADGAARLRVPEHMANIGLAFRPWNGRLSMNLSLRVSRDVADEFNGEIDDYEVVDLNASYRILESLEIYGRVENLTDENYVEVPTYRSAGAAGYAGIRYTF